MALTLVKEDGSGLVNANAYANRTDGDSYHDGHLYATSWTGASSLQREAALVMATRLIDSLCQFNGFRAHETQALQWPRQEALDPDKLDMAVSILANNGGNYFDSTKIPAVLIKATCELARELIVADRTKTPSDQGVASVKLDGVSTTVYDKADRLPILPPLVQSMLSKLGTVIGTRSGMVKLTRV